ncbi:MAG TPA: hypothetical protein VFD58_22570 [Blastocatellia bacterium]|nr:hypothetical protein [Blastocatellia bacterium]
MFSLLSITFALALSATPALYAQTPASPERQQAPTQAAQPAPPVLHEYRGVRLGLTAEQVRGVMGKASRTGEGMDEFKLGDGDLITVYYDAKGAVRTIELYFTDAARAPAWTEVVGNAEIQSQPSGSKFARVVVSDENFWVTMYRSKSGTVTTITISR